MQAKKMRNGKGPIIGIAIIIFLGLMLLFNYWYVPFGYSSDRIVKDLNLLQSILKKIDESCKIVNFDLQKTPINFLTVGTFKGKEIGSVKLAYPMQWKGPYLNENPHIQGIEYQIVRTKKGFFITPGEGVSLPNNKIVGKDLVLDENADIESMMRNDKQLSYKGKPLAIKLPLSFSEWQKALLEELPSDGVVHQDHRPIGVRLAAN